MRLLAVSLLTLSACSLDLQLEPTARVSCAVNAECFDGKVCLADVGECRAPGTACIDRSGDAYRAVSAGTPCALEGGLQGVCAGGECVASVCGDGVLDEAREACDAGGANSDVDPDACRSGCTLPSCGDGVIDAAEACDDGDGNGDGQPCSTSCTQHCGDGSRQPDEECDDGNPVNGDGCDTNCTVTACGNAVHSLGEGCDDGNLMSGDGCDEDCTVTMCGNAITSAGEECDDGNSVSGDGCDTNCTETRCGNDLQSPGEACDDGNLISGDGCDANCTVTACGNDVITSGEECDDGNALSGDGCDGNCTETRCGNDLQSPGEACDDGNLVNGDGCDDNCKVTGCGNGVITAGEVCDDGDTDSGDGCSADCRSLETCGNTIVDVARGETCDLGAGNNSDAPNAACRANCTYARCGDGILDSARGERCDGTGAMGTGTCADFGFYSGSLACNSSCQYSTSGCSQRCGDGIVNGAEICDGEPPVGETCIDYGFGLGRLGCTSYCTPGFDACANYGFVNRSVPNSQEDLEDVWMHSSGVAYAVGYQRVMRWDGTAWTSLPLPSGFHAYNGVWGAAVDDVFVVGFGGEISRWNGSTLTRMTSNTTAYLTGVWGRAADDVFAVGYGGVVLHYDGNTENTWSPITGPAGVLEMRGIDGLPGPTGAIYVAGALNDGGNARSAVFKYEGGVWSTVFFGDIAYGFYDIAVVASDDIWAVGNVGYVRHFTNGVWENDDIATAAGLLDIYAARADFALAVGQFGVAFFYDGTTWTQLKTGTGLHFNGVHGRATSEMILVGHDMTLRHWDGSAWLVMPTPTNFYNGSKLVWGAAANDIWTIDGSSYFWRYDGSAWSWVGHSGAYPTAIAGDGTGTWASAGDNPYNLVTFSSGTWSEVVVAALDGCDFMDLWISPTSQLFMVGSINATGEGCLARSNGGSWDVQKTPPYSAFRTVFGFSDTNVLALGWNGLVASFTGSTWSVSSTGSYEEFASLWAASPTEWLAVGSSGKIWRSADGLTWTAMDSGTLASLFTIWGAASDNVFAGGENGTFLHYDGDTWVHVDLPTEYPIVDIWGIPGKEVWVANGEGFPLRLLYSGNLKH